MGKTPRVGEVTYHRHGSAGIEGVQQEQKSLKITIEIRKAEKSDQNSEKNMLKCEIFSASYAKKMFVVHVFSKF